MTSQPIDAAELSTTVDAVHGVWLQPLDDNGEPVGEWQHHWTAEGRAAYDLDEHNHDDRNLR